MAWWETALKIAFPVHYFSHKWLLDQIAGKAPAGANRVTLTSCYGRPIPIVYGTIRLGGNMVYAYAPSGRPSPSNTTDAIVALCEGPITGLGAAWRDQDYKAAATDLGVSFVATGTRPTQTAWATVVSGDPTKALGYPGLAYAGHANLSITPASVGAWAYEIKGKLYGTGGTLDAHPGQVIADFLSNSEYGAGFPAALIVTSLGQDGTAGSSFDRYVTVKGFWLSPALIEQRAALDHLREILDATNADCLWSEGKLKIVPLGDAFATNGAVNYTPVTTIQYALGPDDFLADKEEDPVTISRDPDTDRPNVLPVEFVDREAAGASSGGRNRYQLTTVESPEPVSVSRDGLKRGAVESMHSIHLKPVALEISRLRAQKSVYIRNTYTFRLGWRFCRLEPLDLVTLTDPLLGLSDVPVRITSIEEEDSVEGGPVLTVEAEDWPLGVGTAVAHDTQSSESDYSLPNPGWGSPAPQQQVDDLEALMGAVASDDKLTAAEKGPVLIAYHDLTDAQTALEAQAESYVPSISHASYTTALNALRTYFTDTIASGGLGLTSDYATEAAWRVVTQDIVGTTFRTKFNDAYAARAALLNAFAERNRTDAAAAQADADAAGTSASSALTLAGSKTKVFYQAAAPTDPGGVNALKDGDLWFNTDTTTTCTLGASCAGTMGSDGVQRSPATHRGLYWIHRWSGTAWESVNTTAPIIAAQIAGSTITASQLADGSVSAAKIVNGSVDVTKLADGSVNAAKIADGAVGLTEFASGLRPVQVVAALPGQPYTQGAVVLLTTDNKLYRSTGSAWTVAVPTSDLSGQITTTQITDDAITTAKIAANAITASEIAANTITAGQIATGAIAADEIAAGAVVAGKIAADAVTSTTIAANAVVAGKIAADAVGANQIAANAVIAGKIAANAVTATTIAADAVTTDKIAASAVTASEIAAGAIVADKIGAGAVYTSDYAETTGTVYPEGTTGTYATAGVKVFNNQSGVPVRMGGVGLRVGRWRIDEIAIRSLQAIASDSGLIWYRGNIVPGDAVGGVPNWSSGVGAVDLYFYSWDATSRVVSFQISVRPHSGTCNFEGLTHAKIRLYAQSALGTGAGTTATKVGGTSIEFYSALPFSRGFAVPGTHNSASNYANTTFTARYYMSGDSVHVGSNYPAVILQLANVQGYSAGHCYYAPTGFSMNSEGYGWLTDSGTSWPAGWGGSPPTPPPADSGGGGSTAYCVAPETEILLAGGQVTPAGLLVPGDLVSTVPDGGGPVGSYRVQDALIHLRDRVRLVLSDGRELVCSPNHPVMAGGAWREVQTLRPGDGVDGLPATVVRVEPAARGEVVRISVEGARTYCANGILSHNIKAIE